MKIFLNSFIPLCTSKLGKQAVKQFGLFPFIDGSCRREPDFEANYPAITSLCRMKKLIPRLEIGDLVIYVTSKKQYYNKAKERRFVAILQVIKFANTHNQAMDWYNDNDEKVSQNIICDKTDPLPLNHTHQISRHNGEVNLNRWDAAYKLRMREYPKVAICKIWGNRLNLVEPPILSNELMMQVFSRIPGTQNPPMLNHSEWLNFQNLVLQKI
ncbi:MAG: hypothetical protein WA775_10405 [Psychroserpens sp.]|uniref:hypothetical protein n=1 Tax=Psychroserpens sp. TaxID=2020870 RepID=UPI003C738B8C